MVQTRDGERLASEVYLPAVKSAPAGQQRWPAVLIRTPYGKRRGVEVYYRFVQRGYAVVIQDVRGREDSTGEWMPQHYEIEDGDDTLNWIAAQPWSDGTVGMTGGSYLGYVQWAAAGCGKGSLRFEPSAGKGRDCYVYDPENPSVHIVDMSENELEIPEDYTRMEWREDMLAYTTEPFTKSCVITGELAVTLYISCDCPDTDFMVRITDVDEQGRSIKLADGVLSAKYRNGFEKAEYLEPDGIYEITIRTTKISNAFLPGHRLRLTVTSSGKNFIFPNSNTRDGFDSAFVQKAHITVHRGPKTPSRAVMKKENTRG